MAPFWKLLGAPSPRVHHPGALLWQSRGRRVAEHAGKIMATNLGQLTLTWQSDSLARVALPHPLLPPVRVSSSALLYCKWWNACRGLACFWKVFLAGSLSSPRWSWPWLMTTPSQASGTPLSTPWDCGLPSPLTASTSPTVRVHLVGNVFGCSSLNPMCKYVVWNG